MGSRSKTPGRKGLWHRMARRDPINRRHEKPPKLLALDTGRRFTNCKEKPRGKVKGKTKD